MQMICEADEMQIISKSIYTIDYNEEKVIQRNIPDHFNNYIKGLIDFINENRSVRNYKAESQSTQVVTNIKKIIKATEENTIDEINLNNKEIAERLLSKEIIKQERISRMNNNIKKGSIIQVLLKENTTYKYLIAKVDYLDFIDDKDFIKKIGFSAKNKDIGKTCLFEIMEEDELIIDSAKIYLDNKASYWSDDFLELVEMRSNEVNTNLLFKEVEGVLKRNIKKKSPNDFTVLRNSLIGKLKSSDHIDYNEMIKDLIENYTPYNRESLTHEHMNKVMAKLNELPEKKSLIYNFNQCHQL
ncbi:MAG: hypothetical protein ACLT0R_04285 [Paraclostridium sordellii]